MKFLNDELSNKYKYKKLSNKLSNIARNIYTNTIPAFLLSFDKTKPLYSLNGSLICNGYDRIVIGDYGAYIEFSSEQANKDLFIIAPGQEYRLEPRYSNVKYIWLTIDDGSQIKIYYQKNTVSYADYKPQYYYISVYEVYPEIITNLIGEQNV
jgi:hypothetical protein